jgi:hypothetical protein
VSIEKSVDGSIFNMLTTVSVADKNFNYIPLIKQIIFYRLKVTSITGQVFYSNIIPLKPVENVENSLSISTLVNSEIMVRASQNYQYQLADISGRIIKTGDADAGLTTININNSPNGIYIMQIICNSQRTTQRIVKL